MRPAVLFVHTPGSAQGLCAPWQQCGIQVLLALGCHHSCWSRWPAPAVSVPMSSALGAENTLLIPFQQQHKCLIKPSIHKSACRGAVLLLSTTPRPSSSPRTQTDRGTKRATQKHSCTKTRPCLSICQHLHPDLSIAGTPHSPKQLPRTGG